MAAVMATLLPDIEAFCTTHGLTWTAFGRMALGDPHLVSDLKGVARGKGNQPRRTFPRRLWPETEAKIRRFMSTYAPEKAA